MEISELLNTDIRTVEKLIGRGISWWCNELLGMMPERWSVNAKPRTVVYLRDDGFRAAAMEGGELRPLESFPAGEIHGAVLCLPRGDGLSRTVDLPPLPLSDLRQMIELDLDRLTPFTSADVFFDIVIKERTPARLRVALGVVPKTRALAALDQIKQRKISPSALSLADEDGHPRFDFLASVRGQTPSRGGWTASRMWGVAASLLIVNVLIFVLHDALTLADLRHKVEAQRPMARAAEKLKASVEAETRRRRDLLQRKETTAPLPILDALTRALPDQAWIQHLEWDGVTLRIVGWSREDIDVPALVQASPLFTAVRPASSAVAAKPPQKSFELTAELRTGNDK